MNAFFNVAAAALIGAGFASTAFAEQPGPRVVGSGENLSVEYTEPNTNVVGGALYQNAGSGESATSQVISVQATQQPGGIAYTVGSGESAKVIYVDPAPAAQAMDNQGAGFSG